MPNSSMARSFAEFVREHLSASGESPTGLARRAGLKRDAIRSVLRGRVPSVDRAAEICAALGLEFYFGPPRARPPVRPPEGSTSPGDTSAYVSRLLDGLNDRGARFSALGCAWFGTGVLAELELDPQYCRTVEVLDGAMAPTLTPTAVALVDLRRTEPWDSGIFLIGPPARPMLRRLVRAGRDWQVEADNPGWESQPLHASGEIMGEALWRSMALPPQAGPIAVQADEPLVKVTKMETEGLLPWAVPYRGRLDADSPVEFEPVNVAWFEYNFLKALGIDPLNAETVTVADTTMMPVLCPQAAVLVDRKRTERRDGAIYQMHTDEGMALRRLIKDGRRWRVATEGPALVRPRPMRSTDRILGEARWAASFLPGSRRSLKRAPVQR